MPCVVSGGENNVCKRVDVLYITKLMLSALNHFVSVVPHICQKLPVSEKMHLINETDCSHEILSVQIPSPAEVK